MRKKLKNQKGITLIALVITIIILIILVGVSINSIIGENGIITRAKDAKEQMIIAEGKEKIELAISEMQMEREIAGESCSLDYIGENITAKVKEIEVEGIKGNPAVKLYLSYKNYMYKIEGNLKVAEIGDTNVAEVPTIEIIRDTTQTGVEEVKLSVKATVEEGDIAEIVKPDGNMEYASEVTYVVTKNGEYTFKAITEKGITEEKTVRIESIKLEDAVEIVTSTGSSGGTDGEGTITCEHIYETKYDDTNHWKQCVLCNNKINIISHTLETIGEAGCASKLRKSNTILYRWMWI